MFVYYFILSLVIIYIIHYFIMYLKTTFTLPRVLDISSDFTLNTNYLNKQINEQSVSNTAEVDETFTPPNHVNLNPVSLETDIDELTNYLQDITKPVN